MSQDDDWLDYNNELRIGILEGYSGILQGLSAGEAARGPSSSRHSTRHQAYPLSEAARRQHSA